MTTRVGINGFGRIGRLAFRAMTEKYRDEIEIVAINDLAPADANAHLLKYDTNYGRFAGTVESSDGVLIVDGKRIPSFSEKEPGNIAWSKVGAQVVLESTGFFTDGAKARAHLGDTVKKVIISAPSTNEDVTLLLGVNEEVYDPSKHHVISNASCTTNCLAPIAKVLVDTYGVEKAVMTTIHAYTNDQKVQDVIHKDLRRARAAAMNMIPTTTGAARAIGRVLPVLKGKIDGLAIRVPTATVSVVDLTAVTTRPADVDGVNAAFKKAAAGRMQGILHVTDEPLVSSDFRGDPHSSIVDGQSTMVLVDNLVKVLSWYDNEWGYSTRIADLIHLLASKGL